MPNDAHLDFETYSACNLKVAGAYRYARHHTTEVLIACYWTPDMDPRLDDPKVWLPRTQPMPKDLQALARDKRVMFHAHNAQFERAIWRYTLKRTHKAPDIPIGRWVCSAVTAAANGLDRSLDGALRGLGSKVTKDPEGARLIKVFCKPRKPTKANPATRILPEDSPQDFRKFIRYCQQDVIAEMALTEQLVPLEGDEVRLFNLDMRMNERGLPIDLELVHKARDILTVLERAINEEVTQITGGIRATQRDKILDVFRDKGIDLENLQAQTVRDMLDSNGVEDPTMRRLLLLRIEAGKASVKKIASMIACTDPSDHVVQGGFLMYGAHTGRYSGRLIQPQNFIRGNLSQRAMDLVFELLALGDATVFQALYEWPIDVISQCMRGFIRAPEGQRFIVVDYTAIEARVLAWIARELRVLRAYREGVDVYKMMASSLFNVPIEDVTSEQRRLGKNLVLGCGYSLGGKRFVEYCAGLGQAVEEAFAIKAVKLYREQHPAIVASWRIVEEACVDAIKNPGEEFEAVRCRFYMREHWLCIQLPSGRELRYPQARATPVERWGKPAFQISFASSFHGKPVRESTYGGKLIENIVQAISRDVMREGMFNAEQAGYPVHGTVHDELLTLRRHGEGSVHELEQVVCIPKPWMRGIPLNAEGFETDRYKKG